MHRLVQGRLVLSSAVVLRAAQACAQSPGAPLALSPNERVAADSTEHIAVLFMQNNSFNKLFGLWDQVNGDPVDNIARTDPSATIQIGQDERKSAGSGLCGTGRLGSFVDR